MFRKEYRHAFFLKEFDLFAGDKWALMCEIANGASLALEGKGGLRPFSYECRPGTFGMVVMVVAATPAPRKAGSTRKRGKTRRRSRA